MNGRKVVKHILKGGECEYAIAREATKEWLNVRANLTLNEILNERIECDKYRNAKIIFRKNTLIETVTDLEEFESNYEFLFGPTSFVYEEGGYFETAYKVWKFGQTREYNTFSEDEKVAFYSERLVYSTYSVTAEIMKEFERKFIENPSNAYSELNTVSKYAEFWFAGKKGEMEYNNINHSIYFELFVFSVFKYGKLK